MGLFRPTPRIERAELIDSLEPSDADFAASFADVARVNRFLGGTRAVLRPLRSLLRELPPASSPVRILDIATGSADIPRAIIQEARRGRMLPADRRLEIVASDNHAKVQNLARRLTPIQQYPEITIVEADALRLPFPDNAFDIALCSLALHHLSRDEAVTALREMERVTTTGFVVNDLLRDRLACALIWTLTRLVGANRLTRHDAPLSVLRAFTHAEYAAMARDAGISNFEARTAPMYRAVLVRDKRMNRL